MSCSFSSIMVQFVAFEILSMGTLAGTSKHSLRKMLLGYAGDYKCVKTSSASKALKSGDTCIVLITLAQLRRIVLINEFEVTVEINGFMCKVLETVMNR